MCFNFDKTFDNKSVYLTKNPSNFPDDIHKKRLKNTSRLSIQGRRCARYAAINGSNFRLESLPSVGKLSTW